MATRKQAQAAKRNIKKAQSAAKAVTRQTGMVTAGISADRALPRNR